MNSAPSKRLFRESSGGVVKRIHREVGGSLFKQRRMENRTKRVRGSNWNHAQTMALAELKREACLNKEDGRLVWERIADTLSGRFPGQVRTSAQCRRRWDTLVKVYNYIEDYCIVTGAQDHRELDEGELASMKLDTAYQQDWYDIVEQVCSQRKRNERCDRDLMLAKQNKGSSTGSHSVELPEHPPNRHPLCSASTSQSFTHHEHSTPESTNTYAQVSCSPSLEDKLGPEEEFLRFTNGNDALMLEATQLWQHGQVYHEVSQESQTLESANQLPYTLPVDYAAQLREPLQYDWWDLIEITPFETSTQIEESKEGSELTEPRDRYLESVGFGAQPKESQQDHKRDDSHPPKTASSPNENICYVATPFLTPWHLNNGQPNSLPYDGPDWRKQCGAHSLVPPHYERFHRADDGSSYFGEVGFDPAPRINLPLAKFKSSSNSINQGGPIPSATRTSSTSSRSSDSTISRQRRRWSLKVILLNILQCCHTCGRK